jgi:hypothetical protein
MKNSNFKEIEIESDILPTDTISSMKYKGEHLLVTSWDKVIIIIIIYILISYII